MRANTFRHRVHPAVVPVLPAARKQKKQQLV
jgi:hypothetical protein